MAGKAIDILKHSLSKSSKKPKIKQVNILIIVPLSRKVTACVNLIL